jgi:hypothetical protein
LSFFAFFCRDLFSSAIFRQGFFDIAVDISFQVSGRQFRVSPTAFFAFARRLQPSTPAAAPRFRRFPRRHRFCLFYVAAVLGRRRADNRLSFGQLLVSLQQSDAFSIFTAAMVSRVSLQIIAAGFLRLAFFSFLWHGISYGHR